MIKKINFINVKIKTLAVTFFLVILLVSLISAFGVSTSYWKGKPLVIAPGETVVVDLGLQIEAGKEDVIVRAVLKQGFEIASVEERDYLVKGGTKDTSVPVTITIPLNESLVGMEYVVIVSFKTVDTGQGGIALGTGIDTTFDVLVAGIPEEEKKVENIALILTILGIIISILVLIYIFRKKIFNKK